MGQNCELCVSTHGCFLGHYGIIQSLKSYHRLLALFVGLKVLLTGVSVVVVPIHALVGRVSLLHEQIDKLYANDAAPTYQNIPPDAMQQSIVPGKLCNSLGYQPFKTEAQSCGSGPVAVHLII